MNGKTDRSAKQKDQTLLDLPNDFLQLVVSHLPLKDNIVASSVCKTLLEVCGSVRVVEKSPWIMHSFISSDGSYKLYDPSLKKTYNLIVPVLSGFRVCYSKEGWLLMYNDSTNQLVFFNPFTRDRIPLPPLHTSTYDQIMAFSCAPTSTSCVFFTIFNNYIEEECIIIKTCSPNAKEWNTFFFRNRLPKHNNHFNQINQLAKYNSHFKQIVFSNGIFYCLASNGYLVSFDPSLNSWNILSVPSRETFGMKRCYMTEHHGKIFLIHTYLDHKNPRVFKLDQTSWTWIEKKTLGGLTIYLNDLFSETKAEQKLPSGAVRDCLCFISYDERKCIRTYYKVDKESVICKESSIIDFCAYIWIIPPSKLLDLPLL